MKKSKVFNIEGKDWFIGGDFGTVGIDTGESIFPFTVPAKANHIQIIATIKKTANSKELFDYTERCEDHFNEFEVYASDFEDNVFPTKEKFYHVVWW